jgi:hypothetical protein
MTRANTIALVGPVALLALVGIAGSFLTDVRAL